MKGGSREGQTDPPTPGKTTLNKSSLIRVKALNPSQINTTGNKEIFLHGQKDEKRFETSN